MLNTSTGYQLRGFLSEMSAEPIHGGGVTLQRVLGEQLQEFEWFAKTLWFPQQPRPKYSRNVTNLVFPGWQHERWLRPVMGCRGAWKLANAGWIREAFARQVARALNGIPSLRESPFLVCPQADITLRAMRILQRNGPLNYVTWVMDDHLVRWRNRRWEYPIGMEDLLRSHLQEARAVCVISDTMRDFYQERFGVESIVLHSPAPEVVVPVAQRMDSAGPLRLVYLGSVGPWQNDALEVLQPVVRSGEVVLDVYTRQPELLPDSLRCEGVTLCDPIPASEVQTTSARYDATVLPLSFRDEMRQMSYFNIATKFSECLGGPVPTLLIGPEDAAMTRTAGRYQAAILVTATSTEAVASAIRQLRSEPVRDDVLRGARVCVQAEMSQDVMRKRWKSAWLTAGIDH
jgi:hypothetical protein